MCDGNEKVLDKIKKLLALSDNNDSVEEAASAAAMAAALMEKHSIAQAELDGGGEEDVVESTFGIPGSHRSGELKQKSTWQGELASAVAPAFGCAVVWRTRRWGGGRTTQRLFSLLDWSILLARFCESCSIWVTRSEAAPRALPSEELRPSP